MTATLEQTPLPAERPLSLAELPDSSVVAREVLDRGQPLRDETEYRAQFYGEMGVARTELLEVDALNGSPVLVKPEYEQDSGSYKRRGATNAVMQTEANTIVTYSTGNHGRGVLLAGKKYGKEVVIELPKSASEAKATPLAEGGATLHFHETFKLAQTAAEAREGEPGVAVVGPFGHEDVVAGQLSVGNELVEDFKARGLGQGDKKAVVLVPAAGLGLVLGVALPIREAQATGELGPNIEVVAVQPENTDAAGRAVAKIQAGEESVDLFLSGELDTDCDALAITEESLNARNLAVAANKDFVDSFATVDKLRLAQARRYLSDQLGVEVEPAAALPMAYAREHATGDEAFVLIVSGKNVSKETQKLYDELVIAEYVRQSRELSRADLVLGDEHPERKIAQAFADRNALRGSVLHGATTRQYVGEKPEQRNPQAEPVSALVRARKTAVLAGSTTRTYVARPAKPTK
ncbi:MAG TPA: pyridoxal-phosphate dependent enzyme [Candidatus Saccharimonadales bacterium]|nr:pyridoxal-phosphate dependent enzyme [Candidatus Saccharimonadales bacterium]